MASTWKTVRVFLSSTFRDMHAERDHLVKVVFPELRERLVPHRIELIDVDLRWGITREQAENDQVLDICLRQIDECRPFFACFLGERYGWVPARVPAEALKKYEWIEGESGKSVTELEVLFGALLANQSSRGRCFFYFRDPKALEDIPEALKTAIYVETDTGLKSKLATLKDRIRSSAFPVMENYPARWDPDAFDRLTKSHGRLVGLHAFGQRVRDQLWDAIRAEHQLPDSAPIPPVADEVARLDAETDLHNRYVESRLRLYVGRDSLHRALLNAVESPASRPILLTGPPGSGKSAVLARVARDLMSRGAVVIPHFVGASPQSTSIRLTLRRICQILKSKFGLADEIPEDANGLMRAFPRLLAQIPPDRPVRIILDAVEQFEDSDRVWELAWLPSDFPAHVTLFLSCAETREAPGAASLRVESLEERIERLDRESKEAYARLDFARGHALWDLSFRLKFPSRDKGGGGDEEADQEIRETPSRDQMLLVRLRRFKVREFVVEPLTRDEQRQIVELVPSVSAKSLDSRQVNILLNNPATENPLYLLVALEELRGFGSFERLEERIAAFPGGSDSVVRLFTQVIERLEEEFHPRLTQSVLEALLVARRGLSERELSELTADSPGREDLFPILRQLRPYLLQRGELITFFHFQLAEAVRKRYLGTLELRRVAHARLAGYFQGQPDWLTDASSPAGHRPNVRKVDELPWHHLIARAYGLQDEHSESLNTLLTSRSFLEAKAQAGLLFDLADDFTKFTTWSDWGHGFGASPTKPGKGVMVFHSAIHKSPVELLGQAIRADVHFLARHPTMLFSCLWNRCWWFDCPEVERHYPMPEGGFGRFGPHWEWTDPKVSALLDTWRPQPVGGSGPPWLRSLRPPDHHVGSAQWIILRGHESAVRCVAFAPTGIRVASGSDDGTIRIWDVSNGEEMACLRGHRGAVLGVAFASDHQTLISGSEDGTIRFWDAYSGAELDCLQAHEAGIRVLGFSGDGRTLVACAADASLHLLQLADDHVQRRARLDVRPRLATCLALGSGGALLATGSENGVLEMLQLQLSETTGRKDLIQVASRVRLKGHKSAILSLAFSPDGRFLVSGSRDQTVRIWDLQTRAEIACLEGHEASVDSVAICPKQEFNRGEVPFPWRIASGSSDHTVRVWDIEGRHGLSGRSLIWHIIQTGSKLVIGSRYPGAKLTGELYQFGEHGSGRICLAYSPDGKHIVTGSEDTSVRIWEEPTAPTFQPHDHEKPIRQIRFIGNRVWQSVLTLGDDGTARVWDVESGVERACLRSPSAVVTCAAASADGLLVATGASDGSLRLYDADDATLLLQVCDRTDSIVSVAVSPEGDRLAAMTKTAIVAWDVAHGTIINSTKSPDASGDTLDFTPDGSGLLIRSAIGRLLSWDPTGSEPPVPMRSEPPNPPAQPAAALAAVIGRCAANGQETAFEDPVTKQTIAWFPLPLELLICGPDGCTWAGCSSADGRRHLFILRMEGLNLPDPLTPYQHSIAAEARRYLRHSKLAPLYHRAISALSRSQGKGHPDVAQLLDGLGDLCMGAENWTDALSAYGQATAIWNQSPAGFAVPLVVGLQKKARALVHLRRGQEVFDTAVQAVCLAKAHDMPMTAQKLEQELLAMFSGLTPEVLLQAEADCRRVAGIPDVTPRANAAVFENPAEVAEYRRRLANWKALPWWKRLLRPRPVPPRTN